jgi:hypothetical protein
LPGAPTSAVVTTANATITTLLTFALASNTGGVFQAYVSARNTATNRCASTIVGFGAQNLAGTAAVLGTPTASLTVANGSDAAMNTVAVTIDANLGNVRVRGTGIAATNIQWTASLGTVVQG